MSYENHSKFLELADKLSSNFSFVEIRGEGASQFLYVIGSGRSAEVSWHEGGFWVEFWESLDEEAIPVAEATLDSEREVENALLAWLRP